MSLLDRIATKEKIIHVKYPDTDFEVQLAFVPKEQLQRIRNKALKTTWNAKDRTQEEEVDNDIFLREYSNAVIKGWTGLTIEVLSSIMAVDLTDTDLTEDSLIEYSAEEAEALMDKSNDFDGWITSVINDVNNFSTTEKEVKVKNSKSTSSTA